MKFFVLGQGAVRLAALSVLALGSPQAFAAEGACTCKLPASAPGAQIGEVNSSVGNVVVSGASGYDAAKSGSAIYPGTRVLVGPDASASLRFGADCAIAAPANATVEVGPAKSSAPICVALSSEAATDLSASSEHAFPFLGSGGAASGRTGAPAAGVATGGVGSFLATNAPAGLFVGSAFGAAVLSVTAEDDDSPPVSQ